MKKYFISYIIDDFTLFMTAGFVLFTPVFIMFMIKNGFSWTITFLVVTFLTYHIYNYIKFNPEDYKTKKEINKQIQALTFEEKQKMLTEFKNK